MATPLTNATEYSVSELSQAVRRAVEDEFGHVRVRGEISGFRGQHSSGHCYFSLKDENATIEAVVWKTAYPRLTFKPQEGLEVIATGRLTTFPKSSKYQIVIEQIEPAGAGALMALLEERRKRLLAEGLFAKERKRPLPYLPRVIGVVTSPTGAVIRDILHRLADRFPSRVLVWPVRVQGETCAPEVANAVAGFNRFVPGGPIPRPDVLIVARGGGSIEDLWGFNEEAVVRAVAASQIPVISAVGHETDTTLIDYVSDYRAPTPTAAAEAAVPVRGELIAYVDDIGGRQRHAVRRIALSQRDRLRAASAGLPRPLDLVNTARQRLDLASSRLAAALRDAGRLKAIAFERIAPKLTPRILERLATERRATLADFSRRTDTCIVRTLERHRSRLDAAMAALSPKTLRAEIRHSRERLDPLAKRLAPATRRQLDRRAERLLALDKLLNSLSYERVLDRGFAVVLDPAGDIVRAPTDVKPGDPLTLRLALGDLGATVGGAPLRKRRSKPTSSDTGQTSLF